MIWKCHINGNEQSESFEFQVLAPPAPEKTQNEKHQCHSKQETKVILVTIIVHFVHLHILIEK